MFFLAHFNVRIGLLGIFLTFAFLVAFFQDIRELIGVRK